MDYKNGVNKLNFENKNNEEVNFIRAKIDKVPPDDFYLTSYYPTYYFYNNEWKIPNRSSMNCIVIDNDGQLEVKELRNLKKNDKVLINNNSENYGIFEDKDSFISLIKNTDISPESSLSYKYDILVDHLEHEKKNNGYIVWVLGPSVVFDYDTRIALEYLALNGYVNSVLAGNAMATHDLEGGYLKTALGQNIYTQENVLNGHYNHLDLLNDVRREGSIVEFVNQGNIKNGFMKILTQNKIPFVLSGSIRDDGPLPEVYANVSEALDMTDKELEKATLVIGLATMLHSLSASSMLSSYRIEDELLYPINMYGVDVTENVLNKLSASREHIGVTPFVTNVQDFVVNIKNRLVIRKGDKIGI